VGVAGSAGALRARGGGLERAKRAFFQSFFRLLLLAIGVAEWASVAWLLHVLGVPVPPLVHAVAPLPVLALNRAIVVRRPAGGRVGAALVRGYVAFAFTSVFCGVFLLLAGVAWCAGALVAPLLPAAAVDALRVAHRWTTTGGMLVIAGLLAHGYTAGRRALAVSEVRVPVRGLPPALAGFRIVQLSDLHIGAYLELDELRAHVAQVNALAPDLVCLTGDLVDRAETCARAFPVLGGLRARHGVLVTLGNHDFYAGADAVTAALRRATDFTVLRNQRTAIRVGDATLAVVGVDDLGLDWARGVPAHPALPGLVAAVPDDAPLLVLTHRPDCFPQAARLGAALVLAGHTHGGQLALPGGARRRNLAEFITRFPRGVYRHGTATLYVNRGLGFTGQPVRLFTPREIAVLELHPA
jgi:predicted MPP superfamily phosphohydrolase